MADNTIFIALGIQDNYFEKTTLIRSTLTLGSYKTSLDTSPPPKILSLHCKQINKVKNELDGQPSILLASMHVFDYNAIFSPSLSGTSLLLSLATVIARKFFKIFTVKQEKHNAIKLLAQSKLNSIASIISQAVQYGDISPTEFHKVLQEVERYRRLRAGIRNQARAKVKKITKEKREETLEQGRKEGKKDFLRKTANSSDTQSVNAI